jgi:hypothetical protein
MVGDPEFSDLALNLRHRVLCMTTLLEMIDEYTHGGACILGRAEYVLQTSQQFYLVVMFPVGFRLAARLVLIWFLVSLSSHQRK